MVCSELCGAEINGGSFLILMEANYGSDPQVVEWPSKLIIKKTNKTFFIGPKLNMNDLACFVGKYEIIV